MRILFCVTRYPPAPAGGAERQALLQAEELARRGHDVTVVCAHTPGTRSGRVNGVRVARLRHVRRRPFERATYFVRLFAFIAAPWRRFDVVHVHLAHLQGDIAVAAARLRRQASYVKVASGGAAGEVSRSSGAVFGRLGIRRADLVQALSREIHAELIGVGVPPERIVSIPNGIDLGRYGPLPAQERRALRRRLGLPEDRTLALYMGRLSRGKGVADLMQAWSTRPADAAALVVVGSAATVESVGPVEPGPDLLVRGWTDEPDSYLRACDLFVHPSHADGMSNVVLEAMACGCPVAAASHGGTTDYVGSSRVDLQACKLEYSIVSPK